MIFLRMLVRGLYRIRGKYAFSASAWGILFNPYFFCRKALYLAVRDFGSQLTGKVLDVGCGTKPYKELLSCSEYVGLEYDSPANRATKNAEFFYDGLHFPFSDESFDNILCTQVLEHVFTPEVFMGELHRTLKPGGLVLLTVPFIWPEHECPYDFGRYSSFGLSDLVKRSGFEIIKQTKTCGDVTAFFQLWNSFLLDRIGSRHVLLMEIAFHLAAISNLTGFLFKFILPGNPGLYLDNVMLIRKTERPS